MNGQPRMGSSAMRGLPIPFRPWFNYSANRPPPEILAPVMQQPLTPFFKNTQLLASPNNANLFRPKFERVVESDRQRIVWNRVEDKENNKVGTAPHAPVKPPLPYRPVGDKMQFNPALLDRECVNLTLSEEKLDVVGLGKPHSLVSHQSDLDKLFEPILPPRKRKCPEVKYSNKVCFGNIGHIRCEELMKFLRPYRPTGGVNYVEKNSDYGYVMFKSTYDVERLVDSCARGDWTYYVTLPHNRIVDVHPWATEHTAHTVDEEWPKYARWTVFIGCLPRTCTAAYLFNFLRRTHNFRDVLHVRIDCDPSLYPRGAARAVFRSEASYARCCRLGRQKVVWFGGDRFTIDFKPFVYSGFACEECHAEVQTLFCNRFSCLRYLCAVCWPRAHSRWPGLAGHEPVKGAYRDVPYVTKYFEAIQEHMRNKERAVLQAEVASVLKAEQESSRYEKWNQPVELKPPQRF